MDQISADLALIQAAAKLANYPVLGLSKSTDTSGVKVVNCAVLIRVGDDICHSWNPITNEKDLFSWLKDIGHNPFHHGFVAPILPGFTLGLPEDYEPALGSFEDKQKYSREILSGFMKVFLGSQNSPQR